MQLTNRMANFRRPDRTAYPELDGFVDKEIYDYFIGCGGLYLATKMIRQMNLKRGDIVLDLGCGFGSASIFLAKTFDITVIAVDLWFSPEILSKRIADNGLLNKIIPLNLDITETIPFAENYFDAIFCMNSLFLCGEKISFLKKLIDTLKPGGTVCIGSECFNQEIDSKDNSDVPKEFNFGWKWNVWESCYSKYHSPKWWKELLSGTNLLDISYCQELEDGAILFEDFALNYDHYLNDEILSLGAVIPQEKIADQIVFGRNNELYPTLYVLSGKKKMDKDICKMKLT